MRRALFILLISAMSLAFLNMPDCGLSESSYMFYVSPESRGKTLKVVFRQIVNDPPGGCAYVSDGEPDTATFSCLKLDGSWYDTTVFFTDSTTVAIGGERAICQYFDSPQIELWQIITKIDSLSIEVGTVETLSISGLFSQPTDSKFCDYIHFENHESHLTLHVRSDSPYVWVKPLEYDSVFASAETTAYLIEEPFPFARMDSFRLERRRVLKVYKGEAYHYGSVELVPESDSVGWATLRVSFSVVPKLGWTLPPVDTSL